MQRSLKVSARRSPLSQVQVKEVLDEINRFQMVEFCPIFLDSLGDLDHTVSLESMSRTDFFTQNIDLLVIEGHADISIHSAKDLPEEIDPRVEVVAITTGVDPRDSLVSYKYTLENLPIGAKVGVCSTRRIEGLKKFAPDACPTFIRGTVDERLKKLEEGLYDALILAEAGLVRLQSNAPRQILDIPVAKHQGQLAIISRKDRADLKSLFSLIDSRVCG